MCVPLEYHNDRTRVTVVIARTYCWWFMGGITIWYSIRNTQNYEPHRGEKPPSSPMRIYNVKRASRFIYSNRSRKVVFIFFSTSVQRVWRHHLEGELSWFSFVRNHGRIWSPWRKRKGGNVLSVHVALLESNGTRLSHDTRVKAPWWFIESKQSAARHLFNQKILWLKICSGYDKSSYFCSQNLYPLPLFFFGFLRAHKLLWKKLLLAPNSLFATDSRRLSFPKKKGTPSFVVPNAETSYSLHNYYYEWYDKYYD